MLAKFLKNYLPFKYLLLLKGIQIKIVQKQNGNLEQIGRLRKRIFSERGYVVPEEIPDIWLDEFDKNSFNLFAEKNGKLIGAVRLIPKQVGVRLPIERYFNLVDPIKENWAEISKMGILKEYRGGSRLVSIALLQELLKIAKKESKERLVMFMPDWLHQSMEKLGVEIKKLESGDLSLENKEEREIMKNYFEQNIAPYILKI